LPQVYPGKQIFRLCNSQQERCNLSNRTSNTTMYFKNAVVMTIFAVVASTAARRASAFVPSGLRGNSRYAASTSIPSQLLVSRSSAGAFFSRSRLFSTAEAPVVEEEAVVLPTNDNDEELLKIRHSSAHVMAMAVQQIYPEAQVTIGPWIDNGFYYDFFFPETTDPETGETVESRKLTDL